MSNLAAPHVIRPDLAWEAFPEEIVAIDLERGIYYNLEGGGMDVFRVMRSPASLAEVVGRLAPRYAAPEAEVAAAVTEVYEALVSHALVVPAPADGTPAELPAIEAPLPLSGFRLDVHADLQELIFVDPVHDTSEAGWPARKA